MGYRLSRDERPFHHQGDAFGSICLVGGDDDRADTALHDLTAMAARAAA